MRGIRTGPSTSCLPSSGKCVCCCVYFIFITSKLRGLGPGLLSGPAILLGALSSKPAGFFCHLAQLHTRGIRAPREPPTRELKEVGNCWKPGIPAVCLLHLRPAQVQFIQGKRQAQCGAPQSRQTQTWNSSAPCDRIKSSAGAEMSFEKRTSTRRRSARSRPR